MATISSTSIPSIQTQSSNRASQGSDVASQIARISQQIIKLTQQIKEIVDTSGSAEDKQKQAELIQQQITLLETQLAQLQKQQAEKAQEKEQRLSLNVSLLNPVEKRLISISISDTTDPLPDQPLAHCPGLVPRPITLQRRWKVNGSSCAPASTGVQPPA